MILAKWKNVLLVFVCFCSANGKVRAKRFNTEDGITKQSVADNGKNNQPNIIFFLADDMGWNDAGWHNKDIYSPNLVELNRKGIQLNNSYFLQGCTPSRSSLMTGYYSFRTGLQARILFGSAPKGLPLKFSTMANRMKELGYATHIIGKWNLGTCHEAYTPRKRGFDTFFGLLQSSQHYYSHLALANRNDLHGHCGYDFHNNSKTEWQYMGIHSSIAYIKQAKLIFETHARSKPLFLYFGASYPHVPHEVPEEFEDLYKDSTVKNVYRKKCMARMSALDHDVGQVISLLKQNGLYENSVFVFSSDNGANPYSGGSNYPLRGGKLSFYEGGTRVPGFIHSPLLSKKSFVYNGLIHAVDWVPTLVAIAGGSTNDTDMDGINMWPAITQDVRSPREEFIYNLISDGKELRGAIRVGDWKLIIGRAGSLSRWYSPEEVKGTFIGYTHEMEVDIDETNNDSIQLFNLKDDSLERNDLSKENPSKVEELRQIFDKYEKSSVPPMNMKDDPAGDPVNFNGVFTPGWCDPIIDPALVSSKP